MRELIKRKVKNEASREEQQSSRFDIDCSDAIDLYDDHELGNIHDKHGDYNAE